MLFFAGVEEESPGVAGASVFLDEACYVEGWGDNPGSLIRYFIGHNAPQSPSLVLCPPSNETGASLLISMLLSLSPPSGDPHFALFSRVIVPEKLFTTYERTCVRRKRLKSVVSHPSRVCLNSAGACFGSCLANDRCRKKWTCDVHASTFDRCNSSAFEMKFMLISVEKCIFMGWYRLKTVCESVTRWSPSL